MNYTDYINILKESSAFNPLAKSRFTVNGHEYNPTELRGPGRTAMTIVKTLFADKEQWSDNEGKIWLDVSSFDEVLIKLAILDGICDKNNTEGAPYASIYQALSKIDDFNDIYKGKYAFFTKYISAMDEIYEYLKEYYISKKPITLYRGFNLSIEFIKELIGQKINLDTIDEKQLDNYVKFFAQYSNQLINSLSNETKEFNSYSTNIEIAKKFAANACGQMHSPYYIILQGEAYRNDINWAFTGYLLGRHLTNGKGYNSFKNPKSGFEYELNINNIRRLTNLRIAKDEKTGKPYVNLPKSKDALMFDDIRGVNNLDMLIINPGDGVNTNYDYNYKLGLKLRDSSQKNNQQQISNYLYGYLGPNDKLITKELFDYGYYFNKTTHLASVTRKGKYNLLKTDGTFLLKQDVDEVFNNDNDAILYKLNGYYNYITPSGKKLFTDGILISAGFFTDETRVAQVQFKDKGWNLIDTSGKILIPGMYFDKLTNLKIKYRGDIGNKHYTINNMTYKVTEEKNSENK